MGLEHLPPLVINRAPKVVRFPADFHKYFVEVPAPLLDPAHCIGPPLTDLICEVCPDAIDPETDAFVTNINAPFVN